MPKIRSRGAGSISPPATPGGTWAIRYSTPQGRVFESGFTSEKLAKDALDARRIDRARGKIGFLPLASHLPEIADLGDEVFDRRVRSHRNGVKERRNWRRHVRPFMGHMRFPDLDVSVIRRYVEQKRAAGLGGATVRAHVAVISALYEDCRERPRATGATGPNPCHDLPTSIAIQLKSDSDPKTVPYVKQLEDVRRIHDALPEPIRTGYAIGVLLGLRTSEVRALPWEHVDLELRQVNVQQAIGVNGQLGPVKDSEARVLPIPPDLLSILKARKLATGGKGQVVPPFYLGRPSGPRRISAKFIRSQTLNAALSAALVKVGLAENGLDWYRATRHTYASQYVLAGGDLHHLSKLLGHASAEVTLRYAHLQPQRLAEADIDRVRAGLSGPRDQPVAKLRPAKRRRS